MNAAILLLAAVSAFSLDKYSLVQHLPDAKTDDMKPMTSIALAAAQGEIESESFILTSDADLEGVDLVASDLVCGTAKIPSSAVDLKVVAVVWKYSTAWMSIKQRRSADDHALIPCMLVHDEKLIVRDDRTMTNWLRGDYEGGVRYINMSTADCPERFNDDLHPVRDAKRFVPCALPKGKYKQFWLTVKVPSAAAPGDYTGSLTVKSKTYTFDLDLHLKVHPFSLPYPRTHYDSSRRFLVTMMGGPDLARTLASGRDLRQAEEKVLSISRTLAEHNVLDVSGGSDFTDLSDDDLGVRCAALMQKGGLPLENVFTGRGYTDILNAKDDKGNFVQIEETDPARYEKDVAAYAEYAKKLVAGWRKVAPQAQVWAYGSDEGSLWTERRQFAYWHELQKAGGKLFVTCTEQVAEGAGWIIDGADIAQRYGTAIPRLFQPSGGRVFTYAAPFLAPDQPSYTRGKGVSFWKENWDGLHDYVFYAGENRWNETYMIGGDYRQMGIVYPVQDGVVETVAFEGYRESIDDVRYYTLLRLLAEKAMKSGDAAKVKAGREALVWFEKQLMEGPKSLDAFRVETAGRIVALQELVGPISAEKPVVAPELKADGVAVKCPETDPVKRAAWFRSRNRDDLALPELVAAAGDKTAGTEERVMRTIALSDFLRERLRRPSAEKAADAALALCDSGKDLKHKVRQEALRAKIRAVVGAQVYLEEFTSAQLDKAAALYERTGTKKDALPASERAQLLLKIVRAYATGDAPKKALELADGMLADATTGDAVRYSLLVSTARAQDRLGETKDAFRRISKAFSGRSDAKGVQGDVKFGFELAQRADDAEGVAKFGTLYAATLNKSEQADTIKSVVDTMSRYSAKAKAGGKGRAKSTEADALSLDDDESAVKDLD